MPDTMSKWRHTTQAGVPRRRSRGKPEQPAFPTLEPFARRLESLRLARGLTQRALAARANISTNHYQDIAHAHANPTIIVLLGLSDALGVSLVDLFESPPPPPDDRRHVRIADLDDLVATHKRLADVVERLVKDDMRPRPRDPKPLQRV